MGLATGGINQAISENIQAGNTEAKGAGIGGPAGNVAGDDQFGPANALSAGLSFDVAKTRQHSDIDTDQDSTGGQVFGSDNQTNVSVK